MFISLYTYSGYGYRTARMTIVVHEVFESGEFIEHMSMSLEDRMVDLVGNND